MAKKRNYRVKLRRRREGKTDYQARKALVTSGRPRLVTRASLKNVEVQLVVAKPHGDEVLVSANSRELIKSYGWKAPTGNIPASYLTGLLCGLKANTKGIEAAILDIGLISPTKGSKTFAVLSGVVDAGVLVPHSPEKIVKERMKGEHIAKYAKSLGADSEEYTAKFSQYIAQGLAPEKIVDHFTKVKIDIIASFKGDKTAADESAPKIVPKEKVAKEEVLSKNKRSKEKTPKTKATKEKVAKKGGKKA
jgi:large subunit ribosomal protein L18